MRAIVMGCWRALKAVIFDVDGTLYRSESYSKHLSMIIDEALAEILGVDVEDAHKMLQEVKAKVLTVSLSVEALGVNRHIFYELVARKVRACEHIPRRPELRKMFEELRAMELRLGCHTNSGRSLAEKVLRCLDLTFNDFDVCVTSDDADPKPMPGGYLKLLKLLKVKAGEALYVGDRWVAEVEPAKRLGMRTALVAPEPKGQPDLWLRDVVELPERLRELLGR